MYQFNVEMKVQFKKLGTKADWAHIQNDITSSN